MMPKVFTHTQSAGTLRPQARLCSSLHPVGLTLLAVLGLASPLFAGERVINGGFGSSSGWTLWTQRGNTSTFNFAESSSGVCPSGFSGSCFSTGVNTSGLNGGMYQQLSLVSGQTYTVSAISRDFGTAVNNGWAEIHVGTSVPANGTDYGGGCAAGVCNGSGCSPGGTIQLKKWDTFSNDNWNGTSPTVTNCTSFVASASTMYLLVKSGCGSGTTAISWDNISVDGPDPCTIPTAPSNPGPAVPGVTGVTTTSITWTWQDNSSNETGFQVYADSGAGTPVTLRTTTAAGVTSYAGYTGLGVNTQHSFQVRATAGTGCESAKTSNLTRYTLANTPSTPTVGGPTSSSLNVNVNVNGNPAATEFSISIGGGAYTLGTHFVQAGGTVSTTEVFQTDSAWGNQTVTGLAASTLYNFQVRARNGDLINTVFSTSGSGTTSAAGCPAPTATCQNLTRSLGAGGTIVVNASEVNNGSTAGSGCTISTVEIAKGNVGCGGAGFGSSVSFNCAEIGAQTVTLRITQSDAQTACCTATITVNDNSSQCSGLCGNNVVTNADFGSCSPGSTTCSGWTNWAERGSATYDYGNAANVPAGGSSPALRVLSSGNFNGGAWQQLSLVAGQSYDVSYLGRDNGSTTTWQEVWVGTVAPINGTDYCSAAACGTARPAGNNPILLKKWDVATCAGWNGSGVCGAYPNLGSFTASAATMYLVLKCGQDGSGAVVNVSFDNLEVCPAGGTQYNLTTSTGANGTVVTPGIGTFPYDAATNASIVATANSGYVFLNWTGSAVTAGKVADPNAASTTVLMDNNYAVQANFQVSGTTYLLQTATTTGGTITAPGVGQFPYSSGTVVNITAVADTGYTFLNWTGSGVTADKVANPSSASTTITMDGNYTIQANFQLTAGCPNLLSNGDFENSLTGWTQWNTGSGAFTINTVAGDTGQGNALQLTTSVNRGGSFGVYQVVSVTPGKTYKIDGTWKGNHISGADKWAEVLLLQGGWDVAQADTGGALVKPNFMYAYDGGQGCAVFNTNFGWIWNHDQNGTLVDCNSRNGERTATGNQMTVVLKTGNCCTTSATTVLFDNYSLVEVGCVSSYTLTTSAIPGAGGSVTAPPTTPTNHSPGEQVSLNAVANAGYAFVNWTGSAVSAGKVANPNAALTTVTMDGDYTAEANFQLIGTTRTLTATATSGGTVTSPGIGPFQYNDGQVVAIVASAESGFVFTGWTGSGVTAGKVANPAALSTTITMDGDYGVQANFEASGSSDPAIRITNNTFSSGLSGWNTWTASGSPSSSVVSGELAVTGSGAFNGGVWQQFNTGGTGNIVTVTGYWRSVTSGSNTDAEVLIINGSGTPSNGSDVAGATTMYRNSSGGAWNGAMPGTSPNAYQVSFTPSGNTACIVLRVKSTGTGARDIRFDNIEVRSIPAPATISSLPSGFFSRTVNFGHTAMVAMAQSPVSKHIYAVRSGYAGAGNTRLYRLNYSGDPGSSSLSLTQISSDGLGVSMTDALGVTFDTSGNIYIANQYGRVIKGTDTNSDPNTDSFSFAQILDLPDGQLGTFHGVGGVAVGPDNLLYINSGSNTHYGPEADNGFNMRILRCTLAGASVTTFASGIRNSHDITFRSDGKLFGVENGPNAASGNDCAYAEEFNMLEFNNHYGFPYRFGSDVSGSDNSIFCSSDSPRTGPQSGGPGGMVPAWGNYGPNGKPNTSGEYPAAYSNGGIYYGFHPHSSPDGVSFYEPSIMDPSAPKFPIEYHGRAFIARFGGLESTTPVFGRDVLTLRLDEPNKGFLCNTFLQSMSRCIDVLCAYNGRVYVLEFDTSTSGSGISGNSRIREIRVNADACNPDTTPPTITCPSTVIVNTGAGTCTATGVSLGSPSTGDNCAVSSVTNNAPTTFPLGNTSVKWTVTDTSGNTATCFQTVTVQDNQNPTITCPGPVSVPVNPNTCIATGVTLGNASSGDNCSVASTTNNAPSTFNVGVTPVTWTATDTSGRTATCVQNVTVTNTAPTINQGNGPLALNVNANTTCPLAANQIALSATDAQHTTALTWSVSTPAATGTASFVGGSTGTSVTVCYQPNPNQSAADSFVVTVSDGCGGTDTIQVNVTVTAQACTAPAVVSAASVRMHGVTDYGIPMAISPALSGVECRQGGPTRVDVVFDKSILPADGSLDPDEEVTISSGLMTNLEIVNGNILRVSMGNVPDRSCFTVTVQDIACDQNGSPGAAMASPVTFEIEVLAGDTTGNGKVTSADVNQTKSRLGAVTPSSFRSDVVVNGTINTADVNRIKAATRSNPVVCP